jgi:ArsR family transcriptional regulator
MADPDETTLLKALTHPARLAILDALRAGEACVCHLEAMLGLRQAYVSQQLMVLREAGLVTDRRVGLNSFYAVTDARVYRLLKIARQMAGTTGRRTPVPAADCPCPKCSSRAAA